MKTTRRLLLPVAVALVALLLFAVPLSAAEYGGGVMAKVLKKTMTAGDGRRIAYPVTDNAEVTVMAVELAPGAETGWHLHPYPVYAYVESGGIDVELEGGSTLPFKAGDAIVEVVDTRHNGRNRGDVPVRLVVFYTGVQGRPTVVKDP